jgi:hypothetical protein
MVIYLSIVKVVTFRLLSKCFFISFYLATSFIAIFFAIKHQVLQDYTFFVDNFDPRKFELFVLDFISINLKVLPDSSKLFEQHFTTF